MLSFATAQSHEVQINGTAKGFKNGTKLYLSDLSDGSYKKVDSAKIVQGKFRFKAGFPQDISYVAVHTKDYADRKQFWVDQTQTSIFVQKGHFENTIIKGSKTELQQKELKKSLSGVKNETKVLVHFIIKNPSSIISAYQLNGLKNTLPKDSVSFLFKELTPKVKNSVFGQVVSDYLKYHNPPNIGDKFLDFEEINLQGKKIKLSDYQNKIVLLDFWGSWCVSCIEEQPNMVKLYNRFKDKGFEILGVATETNKSQFEKAISKGKLTWENVSDFKGNRNKVALMYGITYYPANFLIDKNGIIIAKDLEGESLEKKLVEMFSE